MSEDPYAVLRIPRGSSLKEIRAAYRRKVRETHPDVTKKDTRDAFISVQKAYEAVLSDAPIAQFIESEAYLVVSPEELSAGVYCRCGDIYPLVFLGGISECNSCSNYLYVSPTTEERYHSPNGGYSASNP